MSGCLCLECGSPHLDSMVGERKRCPMCGWSGVPDGPSVWLTPEEHEMWGRRVAARRKGLSFVVLVRVSGERAVAGEVATALGVDGFRVHRDGSLQADVDERPSDETLARVRAIAGVTGVEVP